MIIPKVKKIKESAPISLGNVLNVFFSGEVCARLSFAVSALFPRINICVTEQAENANLVFYLADEEKPREWYSIEVSNGKIRVLCADFLGGRNAIATLAGLLVCEDGCVSITAEHVEDYPDAAFRSFMHDVGRKYVPLDELKMHILLMAKCKMNYLHFHFSEAAGFAIALSEYPELKGAAVTGGKQYSESEIIELVDYADRLGVEIIPEIDMPGHGNSLTSAYPHLACDLIDGNSSWGWALCVGNEDSYPTIEGIIKATSKLFKSKYFHIGTDEISMTDEQRRPRPIADWVRCKRCRTIMKSFDLDGEVELFYHFLRRIHAIVTSLDKRLIIWNDWIDISKSPDVPRDIVIEFWRVAADTRGPHVNCSMQRFLDAGFDVINAHYPDTYIDLYVSYDRLKEWQYNRTPADDSHTLGKIIGADVCAWDVHSHYDWSIPVSILLFSEKMWNADSFLDGNALKSTSRILFGDGDFNIFDYTKDVIILDDEGSILKNGCDTSKLRIELEAMKPADIVERYCINTVINACKI